jgi:hypothetical protein
VRNQGDGEGLVQLIDRVVDQNLRVVEHDDPVGQTLDVREIVRREHDGGPGIAQGLDGGFEELPASEGVEPARGLIKEQQLGFVAQRAQQSNLTRLSFGERLDASARSETETSDELLCHFLVPRRKEMAVELHHLTNLEEGRQDLVFGDETHSTLDLDGLPVWVETENLDHSLLLVEHPHGDVDESGLAGSVAAEEPDYFSGFNAEVHTVEDGNAGLERSVNSVEGEDVHFSPPFRRFREGRERPESLHQM